MERYSVNTTSTRDKILDATLSLIRNEGFNNITIRKIADLADVNIAAVNYHFGSKDKVINEAMKILAKKVTACFKELDKKEIPPKERLRLFLVGYAENTLEYSEVFKILINESISNNNANGDYVKFLGEMGVSKISIVLRECGVTCEENVLVMKVIQMIGTLAFPILLGNHMNEMVGVDYTDNKTREIYIDFVLKSLISE
ncbi:MAG: TetR/AcrR family transcriptional regulator [Clostridium sp.]|uniref:TetR/AcrR family transcriptional regulator n=1 Tax=Clostridium sp. TaxID=1506 RepID=UPI003027AF51